jgi:carbon monoxide dehydrogenase subunit G
MELNGTHTFAAPPQAVWNALHNGSVLKNCIPGADEITWQGDSAVFVRGGIGPIKGGGTIQVAESTAPSHLKFVINRANVQGQLAVELAPNGGGTTLTYGGTVNAGGPYAAGLAIAQGMIKGQVDQFFTKLESQL